MQEVAYSTMHRLSKEESDVFATAVQGMCGVRYKPLFVATQVVAGIKYRFLCHCEIPGRDEVYPTWVMIYRPLPGQGEPRITEIVRI